MAPRLIGLVGVLASIFCIALPENVAAQGQSRIAPDKARVIQYWTSERRAAAIPRDLVIDPRGLGYLRRPDGTLVPYGHDIAAQAPSRGGAPSPQAKPGGSGDTTPPTFSGMSPGPGATIGASATFSATVTDTGSGVKSVSFKIQKDGSIVQSFSPSRNGDVWSITLQGFSNGDWTWWVEAKDNGPKGGNLGVSDKIIFHVDTGSGGGGGGGGGTSDTVPNAEWTGGGTVQSAAGRVYFEMPANRARTKWWGYVCSGTVANDAGAPDRSVIVTAAHCVYDDVNKAFARNVLFIPNQDGTMGAGTDSNCGNDPIGCWIPSLGVVDANWKALKWPDNIPWDYAFYVVSNSGAHEAGVASASEVLDIAAGSLPISFAAPSVDDGDAGAASSDYTQALGYSYSEDPNFMYCAEDMTTEGAANWWLPSCGLSGGSSGGPWRQPNGGGAIISVNSWGYTNSPGMAGPKFSGTSSALCVYQAAISPAVAPIPSSLPSDGDAGKVISCQ